jgi:AraC-like DNA-binding protein
LYHGAFESHLDRAGRNGAEVLVIHMGGTSLPLFGSVPDPDAIFTIAKRDPTEVAGALADAVTERAMPIHDWPVALAAALRADPSIDLGAWAEETGLHAGSVSRGFRQMFSVNPLEYRLIQRTHRAIRAIVADTAALSAIASQHGFADQAHMTRAVRRITGLSPAALRKAHSLHINTRAHVANAWAHADNA